MRAHDFHLVWVLLTSVIVLVKNVCGLQQVGSAQRNRLLVLTSVEDVNKETFIRFNRSVEAFDLKLELIRTEVASGWSSDVKTDTKLRNLHQFELLRKVLSNHKNEPDLVIMLVENARTIINGYEHEILAIFNDFNRTNNTRVLFSADSICWPDPGLAEQYPLQPSDSDVRSNDKDSNGKRKRRLQKRFLDTQVMIGYASALWDLIELTSTTFKEGEKLLVDALDYDLQLFVTHIFLNARERQRLQLEIDYRSALFETLRTTEGESPSWSSDIELDFANEDRVQVKDLVHNTRPLVVHEHVTGVNTELNSLGNYLGKAWTPRDGCRHCNSTMISLASIKDADMPSVLIGIFIEEATPFMENFFTILRELNYPKSRLHLFVHLASDYHTGHVAGFLEKYGTQYASQELATTTLTEAQARDYALLKCRQLTCDYFLSLDSLARLEEPNALRYLIETNRTIVAPLLSRPEKLWSNFWGAITSEGYYERSHDYVDLVTRERVGVWNVPLVMNAYLVEGKFLRNALEAPARQAGATDPSRLTLSYFDAKFPDVKPVLIFGRNLRSADVFQYVTNTHEFGHLVDTTTYNTSRLFPDFYELVNNKPDWEREYLHENFTDLFDERDEDESNYPNRIRLEEPCQDVYWFPVVSERFCNQLIAIMEQFGQWSSGTNSDPRIEGGYESVPTRDIHFKQVGLHDLWLFFLREYIMPIQLKEYIGYEHDPPRTDLAFVVRYHPSEQASLRPHHDSSTYTLNIALNSPGLDYEGGGCRFVRYNCSVTESRKGWALIHPGRLTHYHEGLPVTRGTRYILVTFVDP